MQTPSDQTPFPDETSQLDPIFPPPATTNRRIFGFFPSWQPRTTLRLVVEVASGLVAIATLLVFVIAVFRYLEPEIPAATLSLTSGIHPQSYGGYWQSEVTDAGDQQSVDLGYLPEPPTELIKQRLGERVPIQVEAEGCGEGNCELVWSLIGTNEDTPLQACAFGDPFWQNDQFQRIPLSNTNGPAFATVWIPMPVANGEYLGEISVLGADEKTLAQAPIPLVKIDELPLFLPDESDGLPGMNLVESGGRELSSITGTFNAQDKTLQQLVDYGWKQNWFRNFVPGDASPYYGQATIVEVYVHQFQCPSGAAAALEFVTDGRAELLKMDATSSPLSGETSTALAGRYDDPNLGIVNDATIIVAHDNYLIRISAYHASEDPMAVAQAMAELVVALDA